MLKLSSILLGAAVQALDEQTHIHSNELFLKNPEVVNFEHETQSLITDSVDINSLAPC
jgi:hypothetical protein